MQSLSITKVNILQTDGVWLNGDGYGKRERFNYGKWKPSFLVLELSWKPCTPLWVRFSLTLIFRVFSYENKK